LETMKKRTGRITPKSIVHIWACLRVVGGAEATRDKKEGVDGKFVV